MRALGKVVLALSVFTAFWADTRAQSAPPDASAEANAAYDAKNWAKAAKLYDSLAHANPKVPRLWFRWGTSLQNLGDADRAIAAYNEALAAGTPSVFGEYALATAYGQKNDAKNALEHLQKAVQAGYNKPDQLESDPYLGGIRSDPAFPKILEQAKRNLAPCQFTPENRQFDFWLGEWNVETTQGAVPAGQSRIESILGGCVVLENWQSNGNPYSGKSYNTYNAALKRWEQYWVDNVGGNIFFHGGLKDGVMDYWTDDVPQPDGSSLRRHLQFTPLAPNKVRQFSQGSKDGGKTWQVEYDFTYIRKN